jgi:nicotinamidase-related amidase
MARGAPLRHPAAMPSPDTALVVVDVQRGFDDHARWGAGRRDNPACEGNIRALVEAWREAGRPIVVVRHDSVTPGSPLAPGAPGNALKPEVADVEPDLLVTKHVNSSFHGTPDLEAWLRGRGIGSFAVCGIQTNHCVETTTRVGANLGFDVLFVADACHTFDMEGPDGEVVAAEDLTRATLASLHREFATIVRTADLVGVPARPAPLDA